jgi:cyclase
MRRRAFQISIVLALSLVCAGYAQQSQNRSDGEIHILPVQGNIYMLIGGGGNITVSTGIDGTLLVDTGSAAMTDKVLAAVKQIATLVSGTPWPASPCVGIRCPNGPGGGAFNQWGWTSPAINTVISSPSPVKPIRFIINTSVDPDHTGGNGGIAKSGVTFTGGNVARGPGGSGDRAEIWAHETVLNRMTEGKVVESAWPSDTYYTPIYKWNGFFNGEGIQLYHAPAAHSDGDTVVYFRYSDVISAGDVLSMTSYPVIDVAKGGSIQGEIDALNKILEIAIPQFRSQGGTYIIPGHGRLADEGDVANYRNMVVKIRDRIEDMIKTEMTLQQIKAARPTLDYDGRYGSPDSFIEAAYRSLAKKR